MDFDQAFDKLLGHEGAFVDHPSDPGGATRWGITERVAIANGYTGSMRQFPQEKAKEIYRAKYWDAVHADKLPPDLRFSLFDAAVNSGVKQAVVWLQRAMDVGDDGVFGPLTLLAAQRCNGYRMAVKLNAERLDFMTSLPTWGHFGKGWSRRVVENLRSLG